MLNSTAIVAPSFFKALMNAHIKAQKSPNSSVVFKTKKGLVDVIYMSDFQMFSVYYRNGKNNGLINRFQIAKAIELTHNV